MNQKPVDDKDEYFHYQLVCRFCGKTWWGLHCPHDGYQNPCPDCDKPPIPINKGNCECELVAPIAKLQEVDRAARINELNQLKPPQSFLDYTEISGRDDCVICGFNPVKLNEHIKDRLASLKGGDDGRT